MNSPYILTIDDEAEEIWEGNRVIRFLHGLEVKSPTRFMLKMPSGALLVYGMHDDDYLDISGQHIYAYDADDYENSVWDWLWRNR
jgi:hypothetical protein